MVSTKSKYINNVEKLSDKTEILNKVTCKKTH